jgi:hypothetical protein
VHHGGDVGFYVGGGRQSGAFVRERTATHFFVIKLYYGGVDDCGAGDAGYGGCCWAEG